MSNKLTGAASLAYQGTNAASPSNITVHYNRPTPNYYQGFSIGDFWVYRANPTSNQNELWVLMGVAGNVANWVLLSDSMGALLGLTGNTGGFVGPTAGNINVVGDGTTIMVAGNPGTSTLTISAVATGTVEKLTGNSGGAVSPLAGNINVVGDTTTINIVGNPGTHTLTASASGTGVMQSLTTDDTHVVTPTGGTINIHGGNNITTTGTVGPNTATISVSGTTNHALQIGNASGSLTSLGVATNGQLPIGSTGADPVLATLTAGSNITITNGPGSISIAAAAAPSFKNTAFYAYVPNNVAGFGSVGSAVTIPYSAVYYDYGSNFNTGTYIYTAPADGIYMFTVSVQAASNSLTSGTTEWTTVITYGSFQISNINPYAMEAINSPTSGNSLTITGSCIIFMPAGAQQYVTQLIGPAGASTFTLGAGTTTFTGCRIA